MRRVTWRRIGLATAGAVLVALIVVTVLRVERSKELERSAARFEEVVGPLDFEAYRPPPVSDEANAALPVLAALERLEERANDDLWRQNVARLREENRRAAGAWSVEDRQRAREVVASAQGVLSSLHRAAGRSGSSFRLDYAAGPEMEVPNFMAALHAGDLLFAQARLAWVDGRPGDAVAAVDALAALSRALEAEAPLLFQVVGHAVEILQYRAIQDGLGAGLLAPDVLARLAAASGDRGRLDRLAGAMGAEGTLLYQLRPGGPYGRHLVQGRPWYERAHYRWLGQGGVASGLDYYVRVAAAFPAVPFAEMIARRELLAPPRTGPASRLVTGLQDSVGTFKAAESLQGLARLALSVASVGAERGALPQELPSPPQEDPFAGTTPVYERAADGSATLSVPGADELWSQVRRGRIRGDEEAPLFLWRLAGE